MADRGAKLQVDMQLKSKEFLERESKVYYQVYEHVSAAIREFAEHERNRLGAAVQW